MRARPGTTLKITMFEKIGQRTITAERKESVTANRKLQLRYRKWRPAWLTASAIQQNKIREEQKSRDEEKSSTAEEKRRAEPAAVSACSTGVCSLQSLPGDSPRAEDSPLRSKPTSRSSRCERSRSSKSLFLRRASSNAAWASASSCWANRDNSRRRGPHLRGAQAFILPAPAPRHTPGSPSRPGGAGRSSLSRSHTLRSGSSEPSNRPEGHKSENLTDAGLAIKAV